MSDEPEIAAAAVAEYNLAMSRKRGSPILCTKQWTRFDATHDDRVAPCWPSHLNCSNVDEHTIDEPGSGPAGHEFRQATAMGHWQHTCQPELPRSGGDQHTTATDLLISSIERTREIIGLPDAEMPLANGTLAAVEQLV